MAAALEELINNIQEMVQEAWTLPLSSDKCVIERERMLDLIDELRSTLPADIKMAAEIVQQKNQMMSEGRRELDTMRKRLEEEARKMLSKTEIMQEARKRAKEIIGNAEICAAPRASTATSRSSAPRKRWHCRQKRSRRRAQSSAQPERTAKRQIFSGEDEIFRPPFSLFCDGACGQGKRHDCEHMCENSKNRENRRKTGTFRA